MPPRERKKSSTEKPDIVRPKPGVPKFKPLIDAKEDQRYPVLGGGLISELYSAVACVGPVGSGKTTTVSNILDQCCGPETNVIIFSSTVDQDKGWISITKWLEDHNVNYVAYTSIFRIDEEGKHNRISEFIAGCQAQSEVDQAKLKNEGKIRHNPANPIGGNWHNMPEKKEKEFLPTIDPYLVKECGVTYQYPPYIMILDDLADELRSPSIGILIRKYRHQQMKIIISSQHFVDAQSDSRQNIRDWFLYGGLDSHKLNTIFGVTGLSISRERFQLRYKNATEKPHGFIHIDVSKKEMIDSDGMIYTVSN